MPSTVTRAAGPFVAEVLPVATALCALVSAPVEESIVKILMLPAVAFWKFATNANFGVVVVPVSVRGVKNPGHPPNNNSNKLPINR